MDHGSTSAAVIGIFSRRATAGTVLPWATTEKATATKMTA